MKRKVFLALLMMTSLVLACTPTQQYASTMAQTSTPITQLRPLTAVWNITDNTFFQQGDSSISIEAIYLYSRATYLFFTMYGDSFEEFSPGFNAQVVDNNGGASRLLRVIPFAAMEQISAGLMVFEPRRAGAVKLSLRWPATGNGSSVEIPLAVFYGKSYEDSMDRSYFAAVDSKSEKNGFMVSFNWSLDRDPVSTATTATLPPPDSRIAPQPLSTAYTVQPLMELNPGVLVMRDCSFKIEDITKGQVKRIGVQLLYNDDRVIARMDGRVWIPEPLIITAPTPTPAPTAYPPP